VRTGCRRHACPPAGSEYLVVLAGRLLPASLGAPNTPAMPTTPTMSHYACQAYCFEYFTTPTATKNLYYYVVEKRIFFF